MLETYGYKDIIVENIAEGYVPEGFYNYIIRSGDLEMFKKFYDYHRHITPLLYLLRRLGRNKDTEPFLNYLDNIYEGAYNDNHKNVCHKGEIIPIEKTTKTVTIPIIPVIDRETPVDTMLEEYNISQITVDFEFSYNNLGEDIGNFLDYKELKLDKTFLMRNQKFLAGLTLRERIILASYTFQGDRFVNLYLRKDPSLDTYISDGWVPDNRKFLNPLHYQLLDNVEQFKGSNDKDIYFKVVEWIKEKKYKKHADFVPLIRKCVEQYTEELLKIFSKAPTLKEETVVFRGSKTYYYKKSDKDVYTNVEFMSTTLSPKAALEFVEGDCCFNHIHLTAGTKVIFMEPITQTEREFEMLIPPNTNFKIMSNRTKLMRYGNDTSDYRFRVCYPATSYMRYTVLKTV